MTGPKTKKLIDMLDEMTTLLNRHDAENWAKWMQEASQRLKNSDFSGIEKFLGAYGGMGSFNDLVLTAKPQVNARLYDLSDKAWQLAMEIKHEQR